MQAIIICGGYGTRLKKIYKKTPKALVKINGQKNLKYIISDLKRDGVKNFLFLTNHQSEKIERFLQKTNLKNYKILRDNNLNGTGGALLAAFKYLKDDQTVLEKEPIENVVIDDEIRAFRHEGFWQCMDHKVDKDYLDQLAKDGNAPWLK